MIGLDHWRSIDITCLLIYVLQSPWINHKQIHHQWKQLNYNCPLSGIHRLSAGDLGGPVPLRLDFMPLDPRRIMPRSIPRYVCITYIYGCDINIVNWFAFWGGMKNNFSSGNLFTEDILWYQRWIWKGLSYSTGVLP